MDKPLIVSVIGPNAKTCIPAIYDFGLNLGKALIDNGYIIVCGGMHGLMEAVCKGAKGSEKYSFGCTIGIIPSIDKSKANKFCDIVIPTGLGTARNLLVVNTGDAVVAAGGGAGTLSEIAFAWQLNKKIICYSGLGGWSEKMAGTEIDTTRDSLIKTVTSLEDILELLKELG